MQEFDSNGTKVIICGRQTGKTTALVQWAQGDPNRVVVTSNQSRTEGLRRAGLSAEQAVPYAHAGVFPAIVTIDAVPMQQPDEPDPLDLTAETPVELLLEAALHYRSENERLLRIIRAQLDEDVA